MFFLRDPLDVSNKREVSKDRQITVNMHIKQQVHDMQNFKAQARAQTFKDNKSLRPGISLPIRMLLIFNNHDTSQHLSIVCYGVLQKRLQNTSVFCGEMPMLLEILTTCVMTLMDVDLLKCFPPS